MVIVSCCGELSSLLLSLLESLSYSFESAVFEYATSVWVANPKGWGSSGGGATVLPVMVYHNSENFGILDTASTGLVTGTPFFLRYSGITVWPV